MAIHVTISDKDGKKVVTFEPFQMPKIKVGEKVVFKTGESRKYGVIAKVKNNAMFHYIECVMFDTFVRSDVANSINWDRVAAKIYKVRGGKSFEVPTIKTKAIVFEFSNDSKNFGWFAFPESMTEYIDEKNYKEVVAEINRVRKEIDTQKAKEIIKLRMGEFDACIIDEFNKPPFNHGFPWDEYKAVFLKMTSCRNTTVVVFKDKDVLNVPQKIAGIVIGKGGRTIKEIQKVLEHKVSVNVI